MSEMRGQGVHLPVNRQSIGMPARVFLFTLDQISVMTDIAEGQLLKSFLYLEGRSTGSRKKELMIATNIAEPNAKPDWRVTEREFVRWMRYKGFRYYDRGAFT